MQMSSNLAKYAFIAVAGLAFVAGFFFKDNKPGRENTPAQQTPLISLDQYLVPIPPELIGYQEIDQIETDLEKVSAIAVQGANLYLAGDREIRIYRSAGSEFTRIELAQPATAMAVSPAGQIYAGFYNHVQVFSPAGKLVGTWELIPGEAHITSIAAGEKDILVADAGNRIVWRYQLNGKIAGRIGERNVDAGQLGFVIPGPFFDIALADEDVLWAVNPGMLALQNYSLDGKMRSSWQKISVDVDGFCGCCNPTHLALLPDGAFVTAEKGIPRVKVHEPGGDLRTVVAGPKQFAEGVVIADLAVDAQQHILVLDPAAKAVRIFAQK